MRKLLALAAAGVVAGGAPAGPPRTTIHLGVAPVALALRGDALWVRAGDDVVRLDAGSGEVAARVPVGPSADSAGIVVGTEYVWTTNVDGSVSRIDPVHGVVTGTVRVGGVPQSLAVGAGGVWVTIPRERLGTVVRLDPQTLRIVARIRVGDGPGAVAVGLGSVWVMNTSGASGISQIDPRTNRVRATLLEGPRLTDIAIGRRVAWAGAESSLVGLDRRGRVRRTIVLTSLIGAVAFAGTTLWATDSCGCSGPGRLFRIDTVSGRVTRTFSVGETPVDVAAEPGAIWVANFNDATLVRFGT